MKQMIYSAVRTQPEQLAVEEYSGIKILVPFNFHFGSIGRR